MISREMAASERAGPMAPANPRVRPGE
jgi:hypothetical protein